MTAHNPSDSERLRRVEEAQLMQLMYETQMAQERLASQLRFISDTEGN